MILNLAYRRALENTLIGACHQLRVRAYVFGRTFWNTIRRTDFKWFDEKHRITFELSWLRVQVWKIAFERWSDCDGRTGIRIFYDPAMISRQHTAEQCSKCHRWVGSACEVPGDPERCMQLNGPWDGGCDEVYHPWKYS